MMYPWDYHSDLSSERLVAVAQLLLKGRKDALDRYDPDVGDDAWTRGVCAFNYGRYRVTLAEQAEGYEWLSVPDRSRRFQFRIGSIPLRFYRGPAKEPSERMMTATLYEQFALPFETAVPLDGMKFRIAVETDEIGDVVQISFVAIRNRDVETCWPIPLQRGSATIAALDDRRPAGRDLDPPLVEFYEDDEVDKSAESD